MTNSNWQKSLLSRMSLSKLDQWLPTFGCALAFLLRAINLNARPLWYDEAFAVLFAEKGFGAMLAGTLTPVQGAAADVHPIAYYTMLNGWMELVGQSPLAVRLLSVYAGVLAVAACYGIGRRLFGKGSAMAGMLIAAALPFQVHYGQEARMYAPLALFCVFTIWFYLKGIESDTSNRNWLNWIGVGVSAAAAMYMQNLAGVFLLVFGLSTLTRPRVFVKVAVAGVLAFGLWLPWFLNLPGQLAKLQQAYWVTTPNLLTLLQTLIIYHSGEELLEARVMLPLALFASLLLPLMVAVQLFKARRTEVGRAMLWVLALAFGTALILFVVSLYQPVYIHRALLPAGLLYALGLGWLLWPPPAATNAPALIRLGLALGLGSVIGFGLLAHYGFAQFPRPNFPTAVNYLHTRLEPGDVVVHSNKLSFFPMYYYDRSLSQTFVTDSLGSGSDTLALPTQQVLGLFASPDIATATRSATRVWFVIFSDALAEYAPAPHPHLIWLEDNFRQQGSERVDDLLIYEFVAP